MRCKKHFSDVSSGVGICGSCLRERLLVVMEAQNQTQTHRRHLTPAAEDRRSSKHHQNVLPRSVSPYVSRRKSDATRDADEIRQRFFSTPQVAPTVSKKKSKFYAISKLFRSRSTISAQSTVDPSSNSVSDARQIAGVLKNSTLSSIGSRDREIDDSDAGSPSSSGYSHEQEPYKRTPNSARGSTQTSQARVKSSPIRSHVSSAIGICLSPLLRPSPSRQWKGLSYGGAVDGAYSGDIRSTVKPNLSTAAKMRANRSRKLADLGRFYNNH